jgi:GT2 family glycosyltransferase
MIRSVHTPTCSVCIANYNGIDIIDACIRSVLEQEGDLSVEIIIHDDASCDGSVEYIRTHYPNVRLIASQDNVGFCIANNRMVQASHGQFVLLLNNDAELFQDALRTLYDKAKSIEKPAILGLPQYDAATGTLIDIGSCFDFFLNPVPNRDPSRHEVGMVIGACLWLPRLLWDELGGFPEWFGSLAEDMYLCCLANLYGYPVIAISQSGFRHWVGKSLGGGKVVENRLSTKATRRASSERNKNYVMVLTYPAPYLQLALPLHAFLLILEGITLGLIKRDHKLFSSIYLESILALWRRLNFLKMMRKNVQIKRRIPSKKFFSTFQVMPYKIEMLIKHGVPRIE